MGDVLAGGCGRVIAGRKAEGHRPDRCGDPGATAAATAATIAAQWRVGS